MRFAEGACAVVLMALSYGFIRTGVRLWRSKGDGRLPRNYSLLIDDRTRAGYERAALVIGVGFLSMALMLAGVAMVNPRSASGVEKYLLAAPAAVMVLCFLLAWSIITLNVPRFLVPPGRRGEAGVFGRRHRHAR